MCGIAGILAFEPDSPLVTGDLIERMRDAMPHRGPDAVGVYRGRHIAFGQRRLSIIDLAGGLQPMTNAEESVWVLNNGEIYNYKDLRRDLESRGYHFRTDSDTEVILHGYSEYGYDLPIHLRGMFAAAVWDVTEQRLLLLRDRAGKKPLYYAHLPEGLFFASEIKALLAYSGLPRELDFDALAEYFTYQSIPEPLSIFKAIRKLPPGYSMSCDLGHNLQFQRYWSWSRVGSQPPELPYAEAVGRVRDLLAEAVKLRLMSDVPLGALLSGGIDSSAVVAMMAQADAGAVKTFSIGFANADYDERGHARAVAEFCGTEHHELVVEPENLRSVLPLLAQQYDEPFADPSALPTHYVSKMARQHVTVALAGDGGDEAFAGYDRYFKMERMARWSKWPLVQPLAAVLTNILPFGTIGRRTTRLLAVAEDERYERMNSLFEPAQQRELLHTGGQGRAIISGWMGRWQTTDAMSRLQAADFNLYLPSTVLVKVDRASMLNSLEVRAPLLDHVLLDFVGTLPNEWVRGKRILKDALRGLVPDSTLTRAKAGFGLPLEHWFQGDFEPFLREILLDSATEQRGLLNTRYLEKLIGRAGQPWAELSGPLWSVLMFELWCRAYLD